MVNFSGIYNQNGYFADGKKYLFKLTDPKLKRREYPEVSFGVISGFIEGLMGIGITQGSALTTLHRSDNTDEDRVSDLPAMGGYINLEHHGKFSSRLTNNTTKKIIWQAEFLGAHQNVLFGKQKIKCAKRYDFKGNLISYAQIEVTSGQSVTAAVH